MVKTTKTKKVPSRKKSAKKLEKKTYIALVLDKSSSMLSCKEDAMRGFNDQLDTINEHAALGGKTTVTLLTFNHLVTLLQEAKSPDYVSKLNNRNYQPDGCTAMYDAVWDAISILEKHDDGGKDTAFLVITISDGMENSSQKVTSEMLAKKIQELQLSERWTFAYIGANQDLSEIQDQLNICAGNVAAYTATSTGYHNMAALSSASSINYLKARNVGSTYTSNYWSTT